VGTDGRVGIGSEGEVEREGCEMEMVENSRERDEIGGAAMSKRYTTNSESGDTHQ